MPNPAPFPPHSRVVAYLRDSGGTDQDLSVDQQKEFVINWCKENNLILTAVFADEARPGSSVIGRTKFLEMIRYFEDPACLDQGVLIWKYSRFSREIDDSQYYRSLLRIKGYIVHSLKDDVPNDDFGRLYESVIDFTNSRFLKDMSQDVKRGLHYLVTTYGALPGTPPRGFMRQPVDIGKRRDGSAHVGSRWVPDPALWEQCRQAWLLRAAGVPIREIHKEFHLFSTRSSYTAFYTNRLYLGVLQYGDLVIENYVEPLITQEVWDSVQAINHTNWTKNDPHYRFHKTHPRRITSDYMFSGFLFCARCSSVMNGKSVFFEGDSVRSYYRCSSLECDAKSIPQADIENLVIMALQDIILKPSSILERSRKLAKLAESEINGLNDGHRRLIQKINTDKSRIANLVDHIANDPHAPQSIVEKIKTLESELSLSQIKLEDIKQKKSSLTQTPFTKETAANLSKYITDLMSAEDIETRRFIMKSLIKSITVERINKKIRAVVVFWNPGDS